ncbi:MAG: hypothetical protein ACXWF6_12005 [Usitatibacter sp.]
MGAAQLGRQASQAIAREFPLHNAVVRDHSMSEHEQGQLERMSVGVRLIADVCAIADKPFVEAVENNFAGYFNELEITVKLRPEASDEDVIALENQLLAFFDSTHEERPSGFTWLVKFSRGDKSMRSLFPGDQPRSSSEDLDWTE